MKCKHCKDSEFDAEMTLTRDFNDDGDHIDIYSCWICHRTIVEVIK